jgi:cation diffusion facilitator family transporter
MSAHHEKERSILISLVIDFVLILPDVVAAVLANSITLYIDVLKCVNELVATFLSWLTLRKISKGRATHYDYGFGKLENLTSFIVAIGMMISLGIVFFSAVNRLRHPEALHEGGAMLGIVMMSLGVCVNSWLWMKNYRIAQKEHSPIMESQWHLFRAKAFADGAVLAALLLSVGLSRYAWSVYIDPIASFIISGFLLYSVYGIVSHSVYDLLDKTLDESLQFVITRDLAAFFDEYSAFHGVRSRRSGGNVYIELYLEFDGERKMRDVQEVINRIKTSLEGKIKGSFVTVAPSSRGLSG